METDLEYDGEGHVVSIVAPTREQAELLKAFISLLGETAKDGGRKRAAGVKPSWKIDPSHEAAIFSHLNKWKHGEKVDPDSGVHPLVHMAWRALAIAWQETHDLRESAKDTDKGTVQLEIPFESIVRDQYDVGGGCCVENEQVGLKGLAAREASSHHSCCRGGDMVCED